MSVVGKTNTYDLATGIMLDIEPMIALLSPFDTPLTGQFGADGKSAIAQGSCFEKKVEWLDDELLTPRSTAGATCTTGGTTLTVATGDGHKFQTGDIVRYGTEFIRVTAYPGTDQLTVTRGWGGSTATTIPNAGDLVGVGLALDEGSDPENARFRDRVERYNLTQIFGPVAIQVSVTDDIVKKYGLEGTTEFQYQTANRVKENAVGVEQALMLGTRYDDTANHRRTMGGFDYYITTNVDSSSTAPTEAILLAAMQTCFVAGGEPDRLVVGPKQKRVISALAAGLQIQIGRTDNGRGQIVDYFDCDFGRISILMNRWARVSDGYLFARDQAELTTLRPLTFEMLAKTGDSKKGQIVSERSMKFRRQQHAYKFTAFT